MIIIFLNRGKVSLVQICLPSRSGQGSQLMEALYNQVQAINNKYATESWMPIQLGKLKYKGPGVTPEKKVLSRI